MTSPRIKLPAVSGEPLHVSVTRGGAEESCHLVDLAVCDADGGVVAGFGDVERVVFPRSAMKPLQALALADRIHSLDADMQLTCEELCVVCASHNGQSAHINRVMALLGKFDLGADLLSCGGHWSNDVPTWLEQVAATDAPPAQYNNCSGKHTGMLILAKLTGADFEGYARLEHPVQQTILGNIEAMIGVDALAHPAGIDGCGAPALSAPLGNWARGFALFAGGGALSEAKTSACARIRGAIADAPLMIAGDRRMCTEIAAAFGAAVTAKTGAEGVYACAFHEFGLGAMLKVRDGNARAANACIAALLSAFGYAPTGGMRRLAGESLHNWAGEPVGAIVVDERLVRGAE